MRTRISLMVFGFALVIASSQTAQAQLIPVTTCGQPLSAAGEYVLMNDLNCASATGDVIGVQITASNVTFHLAGHTISSSVCDLDRTVIGIFVVGGTTNVNIDGGNVSGFNNGVQLSASNSTAKGMKVTGACLFGIGVQSNGNRVETSTLNRNSTGVLLLNATNAHIRSNYLWDNVSAGAAISGTTSDSFVEDNIINENDVYGVAVFSGSNNIVRDNAVNDNQNGIFINSPNNRVIDNIVNRSLDVGISISLFGSPSIVRRNTVYRSGTTDMGDDAAGCANLWRNNRFLTDLLNGVSDGGPGTGCIR